MDGLNTPELLEDGTLPVKTLHVKKASSLDNGAITTDGHGNLTAASFKGPVILPSVNPHIAGALWNNDGTLAISAG
jgi:hypothetical protein